LETDEKQEEAFPIQFISSDYCHALPTIRNPLSRIATIKFKLSLLKLDTHARDKFLRLIGERHDPETDEVTIVTDRCPLKRQNYDYAIYLLTGKLNQRRQPASSLNLSFILALYHESQVVEEWENTKSEADMEYYDWNNNKSKEVATAILSWGLPADQRVEPPQEYAKCVENLINEGENEYNLEKYKEQVVKMLAVA